ncbi:MAG: hypothetical protein WC657_03760 [Candidatus Paceibacterota bacterium]
MVDYYWVNDLNRLLEASVGDFPKTEEYCDKLRTCHANLETYIEKLEHWRDTALQISKLNGEANADAERLASEYIQTLKEIGGVYWEEPEEKSPALIAHKIRMEKK